ncbi:YadA-like family protein [Glaesserella parasuis]|nr:YadA-like family protein [Glaesserella parasuis]
MNKIFKVIFNKTTGQFVVVSELSKAKGKASSSTDERVGVSSLVTKLQYQAKAALILGLLGVSSVAYAAQLTYGDNEGVGSPIAIGASSDASGEANIALGEKSSATDKSKTKKQMIAIGNNASVTGSQAIAIGGDTVASGFGSIAIGGDDADGLTEYKELRYNPTSGKVETRKRNESAYQKTTASGVGSISIGPKSQSLQNGTIAVGVLATAAGTESVSIGVKSASKGANSVALGAGSTASAGNSVAIGNNAVAESDGGVALGKDSIANIAAGSKGYDVSTNAETTETNSTWKATRAAVSIGKADGTITRQIKGVAAGSNDTDAVNVAQLKKVTLKVAGDSGSGSVALASQTLTLEGQNGIVASAAGQKVTIKLDDDTKTQINNALSKTDASNTYVTKTSAANYATKTELNGKAAGTNTFKFKIQDGAATATDAKTWTLSTSDTVTFKAGDNLDVSAANGVITYSLDNATKTSINSIASKANTSLDNIDDAGKAKITGLVNATGNNGITVSSATGSDKMKTFTVGLDTTTKGKVDSIGTGEVAASNANTVTGGKVYTAIAGAKTTVSAATGQEIITVTPNVGSGLSANSYTVGINTTKLADAVKTNTKGDITSSDLTITNGTDRLLGTDNVIISLKDADKQAIAKVAEKLDTATYNADKLNFADKNLSNLTNAGNTVIKNQAKQAINVVGANSRVTVNKDTTVASGVDTYKVSVDVSDLATKTEVGAKLDSSAFTKDNVTNKVNTGTVRSTTLDISGTGKVVGSDLTVNLKNGAIDTAHLSTAVQNSITNAKTKVEVNPASGGILKLDTSTDTTQPTTYTLSINETKLKDVTGTTNLATEYAKADASNINGNNLANWKTKLNEGASLSNPTGALVKDSDLTSAALTGRISKGNVVSGSTGLLSVAGGEGKVFGSDVTISLTQDATNKINNALSESKAAETYARKDATGLSEDNKTAWKTALGVSNLDLNYKAGNESTAKTTTLSQGLHFKGEGLTITTAASGVVNFAIADNAITKAKLADNAVGTAEIEAKAVTKAKLADDVTNEIADKADKRLSNLEDAGKAVVTGLVAATGGDGITVDAKVDDTSKVKTFTVGLDDTTKGKIAKIAAGEVATSDENTVTGAKVHTAITSAKTKVKLADGSSTSLTLNKVESTDLTANEYTLKLDKEALKTELGVANLDLYYQGNANDTKQNTTLSNGLKFTSDDLTVTAKTGGEVNFTLKNDAVETANIKDSAVTKAKLAEEVKTEIANAKTVVSLDTSGSNALELTPSTTTGPTTYTLKLNETKLNQSAKLSYKANGDATAATAKEIALSTGLNFNSASTDALTIGTEADGKVNFTINTGAFADTGLAAKNGDSNKVATVGGVAGAISAVNTALTTSINTKANKDLNDISNAGKEVITGLTEVVKDTDTARLGTTTNLAEVTKVVDNANKTETFHVLVKESAVKTALNDDFAAKDATNLGDTDVSAWKTKLGVSDLTATKLKYKGNDNVATKETSLATGLTFASEDLTITAGDNGALNFALKAGAVDESNLESTLATKINNKVDNTRKLTFNTQNSADATKTSAGEWTLSSDDNVNFKAGDGLKVSGTGKEITYDLSDAHKTTLARVGAGSVADNDNNTVTGNTVFDAIEAAKTSLTTGGMTFAGDVQNNKTSKVSLGSTLTVEGEGTEPTTTAANNIAVEADGSNKLTVKLAENLSNIKTIHLKGQIKDGKIGVDANGDVTVTNGIDGTNGTGGEASKIVTEKTIGNQTIAYKANEGTTDADKEKTVALGKGFTFKGDTNIKASIGAEGLVTYSLNPVLTGITSIAGSGTTATFGTDGIALNSKKITGLTNGATTSSSNEAVTGAQLYGVANNVKGILGSSIAIDTNGGLTATNIGNSGKNNVHEAIAASREEVAITGDVLTLTPSKTTDGANKYTLGINATKLNETAILKYKANGDGTAATAKEIALSTGLNFVSEDTNALTISTETDGKVKFDLLTGAINVDTATKAISVTDADNHKLTTAKNVADAINAAKSSLTTNGFDVSATTAETTGNNKVTHQLTKELAIVGKDSNLATTVAQDGNGKTTVKVGLNSTLTNMSSIGFGANAPVLSSTGLDMNDKAITDLASGLGSKDIAAADGSANALTADDKKNAVNVGDLQSVYNKLKENTDNLANTSLTFRGDETGDDKKVDRKLGETLTLKGGADTTDSKLTSGNIAVVKDTATGANGLVVKLAKELTALTSATFGSGDNSAVLDADSLTFKAKGEAADATVKTLTISNDKTKGGSITGLEVRNVESENYGTGNNETRAATESAVKEVSDRVNKAADGTTGVVVYTDQDGKRIVKDNGQFYLTKADGTADKTKPAVPADKVLVSIVNPNKLSDKQAVGNANKLANLAKGTVSTTSTEAITGAQLHDLVTHVGLTPNDTKTGFNALSFDAITASVASGSAVARTDLVNAVKDIIIAVNKGTVTQGDNNSSVTRQLGQTLKLNGGATGTLSDNNIGVVVNDQTNADGFNIKLAKDLKNLASAEFVGTGDNAEKTTLSSTGMKVETVDGNNKAEATYGKDGLTVKGADGNNAISLTNKTDANNTTTPALEFAKGADGKGTGAISGLKDIDPSDTDGSKATNKNYVDDKFNSLKEAGIKVGADQGDVKTHKLGNQLDIKAGAITTGSGDTEVKYSGDNLITKVSQDTTSGKTTVEIGLKEKLALKELTVDDTAEKGKVKLAEDAVTVVNKDSKDAVSVTTDAEGDGKVVVNNKAGESAVEVGHNEKGGLIKLTGVKAAGTAVPTAEISVVGNKTADSNQGLDTTNKIESRISYNDGNTEHKLATLDDGLTFSGDDDQDVTRKLGTELTIKGGKSTGLTENNIGVVKATSADGLVVKLAEELTALKSAKFGTDGNGATITSEGTEIVATAADGTKASATYALEGMKLVDGNNTSTTTASGSTVTNGTTTTDTTAEGVKVSSNDKDDKSEATYGKDGLTVKGADGKDAISLTNKAGANNTATPTLEFAKGTDGKGTGAISGLQDIDPLDTDGSKATNKNYVDSRIADLDAGKPFEYFDNQGNKVVRGKDNQFYKATDIDGKVYVEGKGYVLPADKDNQNAKGVEAVKSGEVVINAMPNSEPMGLSNIRSGLGLSPITETKDNQTVETAITKEAAQTAVDSLVTQTGSRLNNAATVRDLQALAQAGVDFTGNNAAENKDVHRPLGTKLTIEGEATTANQTKAQFGESAADNIHVEAKGAENKLVVSLSKDLKNLKTVTASDSIQVGTDANGVKITPDATTTTKTEGTGADKKVTTVTAGAEGTSIVQKDATNQPLKSAEYKLDGSKVDDGKGNTTEVKAGGLTAKDADSTTKVDANGMDVKSDDPNDKSAATYGKDGLTVKGNDGKDAISLTSTIAGGKTTNTLALNGKDGKDSVSITSGADGAAPEISFAKNGEDGTGSITGLKDVERNPDGTAKDKTQAANAGYVDDRLKEMNEGKPFEYFEKDPVTGEVKTETVDGKQVPVTLVRGKDGKFYKESDLKGKVFDPATNTYKNADGTPATLTEVASNNVTVQAMPSPTGKPLEMGNVGSGLGLDDSTTTNATALTPEQAQTAIAGSGKDGKGGLLTKTGSSLNNVATVKDLQALAQAGLDFVGNETTTTAVHRPLGTKLVVQGETDTANQTLAQFGATAKDNIYVDTDATNNKLVVKMTEDLKNINSLTTKPVDNPDGTKTSTKLTSTGTVVSKVDPAKLDADGKPTPVETANYGLTTELKKTDADGKVTTSTSAPTGTTLSEADKNGNKLREAEYDLDGTKVTLKDPVTGATKEISTGVDGTKVTSKDPATGVTKETTTGVDGTTVKVTDQNNPNNNKSAEYGVDGTALKAKDAQGNDISADYKVGGAMVKDKDNTTEIKPDGMTVKSTDEADKSEAKYGKDGLSIVGPKGKDGKDGISLGYKPDTDANGQLTGTSTPTLAFGKGEKDPDGNDKGTGSITGLKDVERNPDGTAKDRTAAANAGYVDERLAEANATKPLEYFGTDGKKLVLGQDGKFYKPEDLEGKVYVKRKDGTEGYFNREEKDNPTAKPVDLKNKAVDPQTVTIKAMPSDASNTPITMSNVGSGLGLKDDAESNKTALTPADAQKAIAGDNKDGKGGLLAQTGNALNNVATVKDLQAIAQAGLDFTGNNTATTVHRPLGTKLTVEGEGKWNGKDSAANNLYVEAQEADNKLVVKMNKDLTNLNSVTLGTATMTGKDNTINLTGAGAQVVEEFVKWDPVTKQPIRDKDGNLQKYTEKVDPRVKLSGIADGDISPNSTDAVNGRQVYALTNGNQVEQKKDGSTVTYAKDKDGSVITEVKRDKNGNPELDADGKEIVQPKEYKLTTYNVSEQQEFVTNSVITAVHNMNEQGIKFFHTNDGHNAEEQINQQSNTVDSSASGTYATAVGYKAVAAGDNALAMGKGATASGKNSIAIGTGNQVIANKSGAFGDPNIIRGVQIGTDSAGNPIYKGIDGSYAFGNDNVITSSNTFVLGNNVNNKRDSNGALTWMSAIPEGTVENSVYLGNNTTATAGDGSQTGSLKNWKQDGSRGSTTTAGSTGTVSSATVGNMIYGGFAGATANGVVSVGAAGDERRIQNVAAGEISSTSTDAINGSQLYNVAHRLGAKLESEGRQLRAGIAATTAMSNIPQVTLPGKSTLGAGIGTFEGQNAIAVGFSRMSDNGRVILKVSAGATSQGKYNAGAGIALQW